MLDNTTNVTLSWYEHGALVQHQADKSSRGSHEYPACCVMLSLVC